MEAASPPTTPNRSATARPNTSRPRSERAAPRSHRRNPSGISSDPPKKRLRYVPGGPGGGGRYVDEDGTEIPVGGTGPGGYNYIGPRGRIGRENLANGVQPIVYPRRDTRRDRSTRTQTVMPRAQQPSMRFASAAQAAAAVQSDGYKPREERGYEEFHPDLELEYPFLAFHADDVDGIVHASASAPGSADGSTDDNSAPHNINGVDGVLVKGEGNTTPTASTNGSSSLYMGIPGTPGGGKRRPGRPPKDPVTFWANRAAQQGKTLSFSMPQTPTGPPPMQNTYPKEKLVLPQPSYRVSNTLARFEDKSLGLVRYVDKSMANVGYQETDRFVRPETTFIRASDAYLDEDLDHGTGEAIGGGGVGRVEYDMDDQDDAWLRAHNEDRKRSDTEAITREMFEITMTKIEKEWHALEKRIPKPNPKPPQTHRPRSSSAAAVNGEPQAGEEQDSKCVICDDGDCENTNAIVFCDGCDLAVHQECYGVPFIPEGQWLCRRCQLAGRGIPVSYLVPIPPACANGKQTCIFCPNIDGAFKQTNASKWAHLLCAMWIPEVSLGNHTFMEPVMEVEKVPKTRWKLTCYICNQRMGACIQCGNKACYQAFHVTCARKARLFLKMKNSHGQLSVLDGTTVLKAFCDKHCPPDYTKENNVPEAFREARSFYKRTMRRRLWADSQAAALALAATHRHAITDHHPDESQLTGASVEMSLSESKKKGNQPPQTIWKLPSGAPVIPKILYDSIETSLQRFGIRKRKEWVAEACKYWTLKREARRGAPLLKRLQLQSETFSSAEITRRNFPGMGPTGREKLDRRIEFAKLLVEDLEKLKALSVDVVERERLKLEMALVEDETVDAIYFPIARLLPPIVEKALVLDIKVIFTEGLLKILAKLKKTFYTTTMPLARELSVVFTAGIVNEPPAQIEPDVHSSPKKQGVDIKERKKLAKRIIKAIQPQFEAALRAEADISGIDFGRELKKLEQLWETCLEAEAKPQKDSDGDISMGEAAHGKQNGHMNGDSATSEPSGDHTQSGDAIDVDMEDVDAPYDEDDIVVDVSTGHLAAVEDDGDTITTAALSEVNGNKPPTKVNGVKGAETNGHASGSENGEDDASTIPELIVNDNPPTDNTLTEGGVPQYLQGFFNIEGTTIDEIVQDEPEGSDELSEMDDEQVDQLVAHTEKVTPILPPPSAIKSKKAKSRRRR